MRAWTWGFRQVSPMALLGNVRLLGAVVQSRGRCSSLGMADFRCYISTFHVYGNDRLARGEQQKDLLGHHAETNGRHFVKEAEGQEAHV
jgi:hypothetical protein